MEGFIIKKIQKNRLVELTIASLFIILFTVGLYRLNYKNTDNKIIYDVGAMDQLKVLTNGSEIKHDIIVENDTINNISFMIAEYSKVKEQSLTLKIYDNNNLILNKVQNISNLNNDKLITFDFKDIKIEADKKYYFTLNYLAPDNTELMLWKNDLKDENLSFYINGEQIKSQLCQSIGYKKTYKFQYVFLGIILISLIGLFIKHTMINLNKNTIKSSSIYLIMLTSLIILNKELFYESRNIDFTNISIVLSSGLLIYLLLLCGNKLKEEYQKVYTTIMFLLVPLVLLFIIETFNNNILFDMNIKIIILNYLCILMLQIFIFCIVKRINIAIIANSIIFYLISIVYYFTFLFRGTPILPTDIYGIKTARNVMMNYDIRMDFKIISMIIILGLLIVGCLQANYIIQDKKNRIKLKLLMAIFLFVFVITIKFSFDFAGVSVNLWRQDLGCKENGAIVNFIANMKYLKIEKPNNYSNEKVSEIIDTYVDSDIVTDYSNEIKPNIIAIMNESFADFDIINKIDTNKDYMPFIRNLKENTIKGNLFVPTFGGGTALSEWEFLTGNNTSFIPAGSTPYQQYIHSSSDNIASNLKLQGYKTIAIHPLEGDGWNRENVYKLFDFDKFITIDDFENPEKLRYMYISDKDNYKKLIEEYESKSENDRMFIFNVTIQNHGGYSTDNSVFNDEINLIDRNYDDVNEYLTLIKKSDEAFQELVDYFSNKTEPTVILMFGDHYPSINNAFYEDIYGKSLQDLSIEEDQRRYTVPFIIWANYDINEGYIERISANYLSTLLLEVANQPLTGYNKFLKSLYNKYPVINKNIYIDSNGEYNQIIEGNEPSEINDYEIIQYNNMFDNKKKQNVFFEPN
ncbi:LTA synthase family protein [Clostridium butyricum]|uniref:LTA synthase family protein n=1 Tax=Clostridium butyricum TaxID=1492 RepID=UPI00071B35B7|nr:LTA synthase family protein [Clostridium butyricum]ALP91685.1 hypothetical protein ATN24_16500 [Clostridium butyricum]ALS18182.1 hypothetical protein ATD26_15220 [Clostridium butyricum]ANF15305.1 hypothetical protein AZ909_14955 [Clostridium butyricum]AOR95254.1 hypothetical protein BBB49_14515 [Clostridium butyricum]MDM8132225.1 LTA synthase family protein [Clostridium butyricum]